MIKVAIPTIKNKLSDQFDNCSQYVIYEIENKKVMNKKQTTLDKSKIASLTNWVEEMHITDLIVHSIDKASVSYFSDTKINLFIGVAINSPENLIDEYLSGSLKSNINSMKNIK